MAKDEECAEREDKLKLLERHIEEQDAEVWRLTRRVDQLASLLKQQGDHLAALNERTSDRSVEDEPPPPHY